MKGDLMMTASSAKSSTTSMEERDSCYFPGCRKDANCKCEICLASINATLDLLPFSVQKSSLTKISSSRPSIETTPPAFDTSFVSTPKSRPCPKMESPELKSTARLSLREKKEKGKRKWGSGSVCLKFVLWMVLFLAVENGFSWGISRAFRPVFSTDFVRSIGERSWAVKDLNGRLRFLQNELKSSVGIGKLSNCSHLDSVWEINQDGVLLHSRCVLYRSAMEEVSIWGWPLQTAGLLKAGFRSRSFTLLSGRVTEWSEGKIGFSIRQGNSSWIQRKWGASAVQLDPNTWVLEYGRSSVLDSPRFLSAVSEIFKHRMSKEVKKMKEAFRFASVDQNWEFTEKIHLQIPT